MIQLVPKLNHLGFLNDNPHEMDMHKQFADCIYSSYCFLESSLLDEIVEKPVSLACTFPFRDSNASFNVQEPT